MSLRNAPVGRLPRVASWTICVRRRALLPCSSSPTPVLTDESFQRYVKALYPVALMLILVPLVDLALRVSPPQFGSLQWRFQTVGLLLGNYGTITLGVGLFGLAAVLTGQRPTLRTLGYFAFALAVISIAVLALFLLDAVQMRQVVTAPMKRAVLTASGGAVFTGLFGSIVFVIIGRAALAASRRGPAAVAARRPAAPAPLVVAGQSAGDAL